MHSTVIHLSLRGILWSARHVSQGGSEIASVTNLEIHVVMCLVRSSQGLFVSSELLLPTRIHSGNGATRGSTLDSVAGHTATYYGSLKNHCG